MLRKCVHCGFCIATCPTYVLLGDELDSPRGRIYLIKDMLEQDRPATAAVVRHLDRCLSCLGCMTTCPSGVHYQHLIDHARDHVERTYRRPLGGRVVARDARQDPAIPGAPAPGARACGADAAALARLGGACRRRCGRCWGWRQCSAAAPRAALASGSRPAASRAVVSR